MDQAPADLGIARILGQVRPLDFPAIGRKLAVVAHGHDQSSVLRIENLVRHRVGMGIAVALGLLARHQMVDGRIAAEGKDAIQQSHVDMLPLPAALPPRQRGRDRKAGVHARCDIRDRDAHFLRTAARQSIGLASNAHQTAHALEDEVVPRTVPIGPRLAEPRDRAIDQRRIDGPQILVAQPIARQRADLVVLHQHVGILGQPANDFLPLRGGNIHGHGLLAAVGRSVVTGVLARPPVGVRHPGRAPAPGVVPGAGAFDLDDFGTQIGKVLGTPGPRQHPGQVQHAYVRKRFDLHVCGLDAS
ncbi:hypothetical protein D9M68_556320 [compost metagenome]